MVEELERGEMIRVSQAAKRLNLPVSNLHRYITAGYRLRDGQTVRLRGQRIGRCWYVSLPAVERFVELINTKLPEIEPARSA